MRIVRIMAGALLAAGLFAGSPASAQFFLKSYDFRGGPVTGLEPELGMPLPGATPAEVRAGLTWNLRAALNVAALQCDFAPTLLTVDQYNAMIKDHSVELKSAFDTLNAYFVRTAKTKAAGQSAFDRFGTRTYSAFATVRRNTASARPPARSAAKRSSRRAGSWATSRSITCARCATA